MEGFQKDPLTISTVSKKNDDEKKDYRKILSKRMDINIGDEEIYEKLDRFADFREKLIETKKNINLKDKVGEKDKIDGIYNELMQELELILPEDYSLVEKLSMNGKNWRGDDPIKTLIFLMGEKNKLKISSDNPNVAEDWYTSLGYGRSRGKLDEEGMPFVMSLCFNEPENWDVKNVENCDKLKTIKTVDGDIEFKDVKGIAVRIAGNEEGEVFPPKFYELVKEEK